MWSVRLKVVRFAIVGMLSGCAMIAPDFNTILAKAKAEQHAMMQEYVNGRKFGQALPRLEGRRLSDIMGGGLSAAQQQQVKKAVDAEFVRCKTEIVFPKWVEFRSLAIAEEIEALVEEARKSAATNGFALAREKFEAAREAGWQGSVIDVGLDGAIIPEVYAPVHKFAVDMIDEKVGVAEWPIVEIEMNQIVTNAVVSANLEDGIAALRDYKFIRAYTKVLDGKVDAIVGELKRMGIREDVTKRISAVTVECMRKYENLSDLSEQTVQETRKVGGTADPRDGSTYKELIKAYEEALRLYNCTDQNTKKIIDALAKLVAKIVDTLPPAQPAVEVKSSKLVRLGPTALNNRIEKLRRESIAYLEKSEAEVKARGEELDKLLRGDSSAAFAKVGDILLGVEQANETVRALAMKKLLTEINPAILKSREEEMRAMVETYVKSGQCVEGVAKFAAYRPFVRTYAEDIDRKFNDVRAAAAAFGVQESKARAIMDDVAKTAAELEYLADYTDKLVDEVTPGMKVPAEKIAAFETAVTACHESLIRNGSTEKNADMLVTAIRQRFAAEKAVLEADVHRGVVYLGSNALNRRLAELKIKYVGELIGRCVSAQVSKNRFAEARAVLRDVALTDDEAFDGAVYAIRVGVLNTVVNPVQCEAFKKDITRKIGEFWGKGDYRAARDWMAAYPYVHDTYPDMLKAGKAIQAAMERLKIEEPDPEQYVKKLQERLAQSIESAKSDYALPSPKHDLSELERAIGLFEKAYLAHCCDRKAAEAVCADIRRDINLFLDRPTIVLSTADANVELRAFMEAEVRRCVLADAEARRPRYQLAADPVEADRVKDVILEAAKKGMVAFAAGKSKEEVYAEMAMSVAAPAIEWLASLWNELNAPKTQPTDDDAKEMSFGDLMDMLVRHQEYLELLASMDKEVVYDSQIAMAEDAISKQLDKAGESSRLAVNAALGEYARAIRLLKQAKVLNEAQGAALVFGSVYLDQAAVFVRALELGARPDGVCDRDPLRRTPLLLAIQLGRTAFVHRLVDRGVSMTSVDANGDTAVHYAVRRGNLAVLKAMLVKVDVNALNAARETALFDAARINDAALVQALVDAKVDVRKANAEGRTAIDAACQAGSRDVLEPLAAAGAAFGAEQLVLAAANGRLAVVQWLVSKGVDVNAPGVYEASEKMSSVREFLIRQGCVKPAQTK